MLVVFLHIPINSSKMDLQLYVEQALKPCVLNAFQRPGKIVDIKLLRLENRHLKTDELHSIMHIEPDSAALKIIRRFNRKKFNGKYINVREYKRRFLRNDARKVSDKLFLADKKTNRRIADRRRDYCVPVCKVRILGEKINLWSSEK